MKRNRHGRSLTGVMLTFAAITLSLSFLVPQLRGWYEAKLMSRASLELRHLETAVTSYWRHHNNTYPTDLSTLLDVEPKVLVQSLKDPFHPEAAGYGYVADSRIGYYVLWTRGPRQDSRQPRIDGGRILFSGSGIAVSNFPVERE